MLSCYPWKFWASLYLSRSVFVISIPFLALVIPQFQNLTEIVWKSIYFSILLFLIFFASPFVCVSLDITLYFITLCKFNIPFFMVNSPSVFNLFS